MADLKTKPTKKSVTAFIKSIENKRRADCQTLLSIMKRVTGVKPVMWGDSIVGFGEYHYKYKSGREGDWFITGFSPRKQNISVYIMPGFSKYKSILNKIGKHKISVSCLYINKLDDINKKQLEILISRSVKDMIKLYDIK